MWPVRTYGTRICESLPFFPRIFTLAFTDMAIILKDCEYTDGPMPSPTQLLERDVARLEARIRELEADPQRMQSTWQ